MGSDIAICNCLYGSQAVYNQDLAAALCRATNDWLAEEWLGKDDRFRASIVIPWQSPELAAEEIERRAPDRRFVQVLMMVSGEMPKSTIFQWEFIRAQSIAPHHGPMAGHRTISKIRPRKAWVFRLSFSA